MPALPAPSYSNITEQFFRNESYTVHWKASRWPAFTAVLFAGATSATYVGVLLSTTYEKLVACPRLPAKSVQDTFQLLTESLTKAAMVKLNATWVMLPSVVYGNDQLLVMFTPKV